MPHACERFCKRSFKIAQNLFALATQHARAPKMDSSETEVLQQNKSCVLLAKSTWTMKIPDVTFLPVPIDMAFIPSAPWQQFKHFLHLSTETDLDKGGTNLMSKTETKRAHAITCHPLPVLVHLTILTQCNPVFNAFAASVWLFFHDE